MIELAAPSGLAATILTLGATLQELRLPGGTDVVLRPEAGGYAGATVGRYANRIAGGTFTLGGATYQVPVNDPPNALHGGIRGFDKREWRVVDSSPSAVTLAYAAADGEEGFPGRLEAEVTYTLEDEALRIAYRAVTDARTVVNLTNHTYWNLAGTGRIDGHELQVDGSRYLPVDATGIPSGELAPVEGTRLDLRAARVIESETYDHCFVLDGGAVLRDAASGRTLTVETTEPGLQVYTGDMLALPRTGIALEAQHFPDSPNRPAFPSVVLEPGDAYASSTTFRLSW